MRCVFSTRDGIGAELIRRKEGGTSSHCGIILRAGTPLDTAPWVKLKSDVVLDAQPFVGVQVHDIAPWREQHTVLRVYDVPLPNEQAARDKALSMEGWGYDWWRNVGYVLWREMGRSRNVNCEELVLLAWVAGGMTLSDRAPRPTVRMLRELSHAHGTDVTHEYTDG